MSVVSSMDAGSRIRPASALVHPWATIKARPAVIFSLVVLIMNVWTKETLAQSVVQSSATWSCTPPTTACRADLCVDLQSDSDNCGACGHSCRGAACLSGRCATRWDREEFVLGVGFGGLWGNTSLESAMYNSQSVQTYLDARHDFTPYQSNFLFTFQLGGRGKRFAAGARFGLGHSEHSALDGAVRFLAFDTSKTYWDEKISRTYLRTGGYFDVHAYTVDFAGINLTVYGEAALSIDIALYRLQGDAAFNQDPPDAVFDGFVSMVPGFGVGVDAGVLGGLRVGLYGGFNIVSPVAHFVTEYELPEDYEANLPDAFIAGETRATLMYRFGGPPRTTSKDYALLVETSNETPADAATVTMEGYAQPWPAQPEIAVIAPTACLAELQPTRAAPRGTVGRCARALDLLESTLTQRGYRVITWRSVAAGGAKPVDSARQLGARLAVEVSSLETGARLTQPPDTRWLHSDVFGHRGPPLESHVALSAHDTMQLAALTLAVRGLRGASTVPGVHTDVKLVDTATGKSLWRYQWERRLNRDQEVREQLLVQATPHSNGKRTWSQTAPLARPRTDETGQRTQDGLLEVTVRDLVTALQSAHSRSSAP